MDHGAQHVLAEPGTEGIHAALARATDAACGKDVRVGGGAATIREYLAAGLLDELHVAISPVLLGAGEQLFAGIDVVIARKTGAKA